jgi:hypothetical protein
MPAPPKEVKLTKEEKKALAEEAARQAAEAAAKAAEEERLRLEAEKAARKLAWNQQRTEELSNFTQLTSAVIERTSQCAEGLKHTHMREC